MENISAYDEQLILDFIDGHLDSLKAREVEDQIRNSAQLKSRFEELLKIHAALKASAHLETPSRDFTRQVMDKLDSFRATSVLSPRNGLLLFGGIVVAIGIGLLLLKAGAFDTFNGTVAFDSIPIRKDWIKSPLPALPVSGKRIMEIALMVITGLSFVLLDRTVLRPFFGRRAGSIV